MASARGRGALRHALMDAQRSAENTPMAPLDHDVCYQALRGHDRRFDGLFFVAVHSTGIYCRPICPARPVSRQGCAFYRSSALAEQAGFRACLRCRPELAPGAAPVDASPRLARAALGHINAGYLVEHSIEALAEQLEVSDRHLRRVIEHHYGVSPVELEQTRRLGLAKRLLQDTSLPLSEVAFASGFGSIRRFNTAFRARFQRPPSALRKASRARRDDGALISLRLDFRPPYAWAPLLAFLRARAIPGVEVVSERSYQRSVQLDDRVGWLEVAPVATQHALLARVSSSLLPVLAPVVERLRHLFDLDVRPDLVEAQLRRRPALRALVRRVPGLRVPGAFDPFELAMRCVLGQQVTVKGATTLAGRLVDRFGGKATELPEGLQRTFPSAATIAQADVSALASLGLPRARAQALRAVAKAFARGTIDVAARPDPERFLATLQELPGVGPWTANYLAMRALHWPDAFPAGDLVLRQRLGVETANEAIAWAEPLRPWRAYAVLHLWNAPGALS